MSLLLLLSFPPSSKGNIMEQMYTGNSEECHWPIGGDINICNPPTNPEFTSANGICTIPGEE